jgi:DNA-binding response OmpR family regulator
MSPKILIIDDDEMLCEELAEILAENGYDVETVFDGREGLNAIQKIPYDVVLLDIKMPRMNGLEAFKEIKEGKAAPKVIILSANHSVNIFLGETLDMPQDQSQQILGLADGVMNKPYDVEILLARIRGFLSEPRSCPKHSPEKPPPVF